MESPISAIMSGYRAGDYAGALAKTEELRNGSSTAAPYYFFRGSMLRHLGRLSESEESLREGLFLEKGSRQRALVFQSLGSVLMDQQRFAEAVECYENASRACPDNGTSRRGIAEALLRQGREFPEALKQAQEAVAIDKRAEGPSREALDCRLGEDLAVLAWALAANSAGADTIVFLLAEALRLCGKPAHAILAQVHYRGGQAYLALQDAKNAREHFRQAAEVDPQGIFGRMARSTIS